MKIKIILALLLSCVFSAEAQITAVDTNTVHAIGGRQYITGDPNPLAFTKIMVDLYWLQNWCATNSATNLVLSAKVDSLVTNVAALVTNTASLDGVVSVISSLNTNVSALDNLITALPGTNILGGTVATNNFSTAAMGYFGLFPYTGTNLVDNGFSTGAGGDVPIANGDGTWTWQVPAGGASSVTNFSLTVSNQNYATSPTTIAVGVTNGIGYFIFGVPTNAPNLVTNNYYNLSNTVVSSATLLLMNTNFNFAYSNFLGVFTNVSRVAALGPVLGGGGLTPGTNATTSVFYSPTGTSGWTTNMPALPNITYIAVTTVSTGGFGKVQINAIQNSAARGNTNDLTFQTTYVDDAVDARSPVTYSQFQLMLANTATFQSTGTNYACFINGQRMIEAFPPNYIFSTNATLVVDATGTNLALSFSTANLVTGSFLIMSTNLLQFGGGFQPYNGPYTLTTGGGTSTWTIPMYAISPSYSFFQVAGLGHGTLQADYAMNFYGGTAYPSNGWSLTTITNALAALGPGKHYLTTSSNGLALVTLSYSNGVVRYVQALY